MVSNPEGSEVVSRRVQGSHQVSFYPLSVTDPVPARCLEAIDVSTSLIGALTTYIFFMYGEFCTAILFPPNTVISISGQGELFREAAAQCRREVLEGCIVESFRIDCRRIDLFHGPQYCLFCD